jgi:hypothetical protein
MPESKKPIVVSVLIIALGVSWLLNTLHVIPDVDWVWTAGIGICGVLVFVAGEFNKLTFVVGTLLLTASVLSVLRQTGRLRVDVEVPVLVIALGVLVLLSHLFGLKTPELLQEKKP